MIRMALVGKKELARRPMAVTCFVGPRRSRAARAVPEPLPALGQRSPPPAPWAKEAPELRPGFPGLRALRCCVHTPSRALWRMGGPVSGALLALESQEGW